VKSFLQPKDTYGLALVSALMLLVEQQEVSFYHAPITPKSSHLRNQPKLDSLWEKRLTEEKLKAAITAAADNKMLRVHMTLIASTELNW